MRYATVKSSMPRGGTPEGEGEAVARYLPSGWQVLSTWAEGVYAMALIGGTDRAGWTLDDYVIPRLASGMRYASEVDAATARHLR